MQFVIITIIMFTHTDAAMIRKAHNNNVLTNLRNLEFHRQRRIVIQI